MKKQIVTMLCGAVAVALAVPAFSATTTFSGLLRTQGISQNIATGRDMPNNRWITQRLSPRLDIAVNDNVKIVYAGEMDIDWGGRSNTNLGWGGAQSTDGINLETKNLFASVKLTDFSFNAGIQTVRDGIQGVFFADDVASLTAAAKFGSVDLGLGYAKPAESDSAAAALAAADYSENDDTDVYFVKAGVVPAEGSKAGAELYWLHGRGQSHGQGRDIYTLAVTGATKVAGVAVDGFFAFQNGTLNVNSQTAKTTGSTTAETDLNAFAGSIAGSMKFSDNLSGNLRLIYFGNDNNKKEIRTFQDQYVHPVHRANFIGSNMPIFLSNAGKNSAAFSDNVADQFLKYGLLAAVANVEYTMAPYYVKGAVGYFQTLTNKAYGNTGNRTWGGTFQNQNDTAQAKITGGGTTLGYEFFLQAGTKIADAANVYFRGGYAILGDAFDKAVTSSGAPSATAGTKSADNMYFASIGMDIPF